MMEPCVTHVVSSQYLGSDGNVRSAPTTTFALSAIMETNTISDIGFIESQHLAMRGIQHKIFAFICFSSLETVFFSSLLITRSIK